MNERTYLPVAMVTFVALAGCSCANGRNAGSVGGTSAVASSTLGSGTTPTRGPMTSNTASNGDPGNGGPNDGSGAGGDPQDSSSAGGGAPIAAGDAVLVQAHLPEELLRSILGCWRLGDQEEWTISRTKEGGALVARRLLVASAGDAGYAQRAAVPANVSYDARGGTLVFFTAGPRHALRFVFTVGPAGLTGIWASSHAPGAEYRGTGSSVTLRRCGV